MKLSLALFVLFLTSITPSWANWQERQFSHQLSASLFIPGGQATDYELEHVAKRALIVHLHGCAQSTKVLREHANWEEVALEKNLIVALPQVPGGGVYAGCWDYYGKNHQRDNRHNQHLLEMVTLLLEDTQLNIDPKKVFITGLSSGAGQAMVLACLAPDVFSGAGLVATPMVGTEVSEISRPKLSAAQGLKICLDLADKNQEDLKKQKVSVVVAPNDTVVSSEHGKMIKEIYQLLFLTNSQESLDLNTLPGTSPKGTLEIYRDEKSIRLSFIEHIGLGHNWPAGQGGRSTGFVYKDGLNYPMYLASFFLD